MKNKRTNCLFIAIALLVGIELTLWWTIKRHYWGSFNKYFTVQQKEFCSKMSSTFYGYDHSYSLMFLSEAKEIINKPIEEFTIEKAIAIREALLNITHIENVKNKGIKNGPIELLRGLRTGKALSCWEISLVYGYMLNLMGFHVRNISVSRSLFDIWDSHTTVELWDEKRGKWILSDPTFNVSFKKNDEYLSSDELYELIHSGNYNLIRVLHGKATKYEYSLDKYYISYFSLFDNLFYISHIHLKAGILKYPPLRWFDNRLAIKLIMTDRYSVRGNEIHIQNTLMFLTLFLIPMAIIATSFIGCTIYALRFLMRWRNDRKV